MTTMYSPGQYRKIKSDRDALLEAAKEMEQAVRLGIPQEAVPLIANYGMWHEFCSARIHIEEAIARAENPT